MYNEKLQHQKLFIVFIKHHYQTLISKSGNASISYILYLFL